MSKPLDPISSAIAESIAGVLAMFDPRLPSRFWDKVSPEPNSGCWLWCGYLLRGYARFRYNGVTQYGHRVSYSALVGNIPVGFEIDHLCRNECCVNPMHLEAVPPYVNNMRSNSPSAIHSRATHCVHGHSLAGENLRIRPSGKRECVECVRRLKRETWNRYKDTINAERRAAYARTMKHLDPCSQAIADSLREVLAQHDLVICRAPDTSFPKLGADLDKVLRECSRNAAQSVLLVQDEARVEADREQYLNAIEIMGGAP